MTRATILTAEQVGELLTLARNDPVLWAELKDRELEIEKRLADAARQGREPDDPDVIFDPPKMPTLSMMISDLVKSRHGQNETFYHGNLAMAVRTALRKELGLLT